MTQRKLERFGDCRASLFRLLSQRRVDRISTANEVEEEFPERNRARGTKTANKDVLHALEEPMRQLQVTVRNPLLGLQ